MYKPRLAQTFFGCFGLLLLVVASCGSTKTSATVLPQIFTGGGQTCLITQAGGLLCWGANDDGEVGDGTTMHRSVPTAVSGLSAGVVDVGAGLDHTCALLVAGTAKCWGQGGDGQLGSGAQQTSNVPLDVPGMSGATSLDAGYWHTCAIKQSGTLECWGLNWFGQLGEGTVTLASSPVAVLDETGSPLSGVIEVSSGMGHTCTVMSNSGVKCWGWNNFGQLGNTSPQPCDRLGEQCSMAPVDVVDINGLPLAGIVDVEAGMNYTCALSAVGEILCWGSNNAGQLGVPSPSSTAIPTLVQGVGGAAAAISVVGVTTCALRVDGGALCWGHNLSGQLGNGTTSGFNPNPSPSPVSGFIAAQISAGAEHTCAVGATGAPACWGDNYFGQLGDGTTTDRLIPTSVIGVPGFDSDLDGCFDSSEQGLNEVLGGQRNPKSFWDFFDTPDGANVRDRAVTAADIFRVLGRFSSSGDPMIDPLSAPPAGGYHTAFDRGGLVGPDPWDLGPADGSIAAVDIFAVLAQFGHSCP